LPIAERADVAAELLASLDDAEAENRLGRATCCEAGFFDA
jgi:hypothetical protein